VGEVLEDGKTLGVAVRCEDGVQDVGSSREFEVMLGLGEMLVTAECNGRRGKRLEMRNLVV